MSPIRLTAPWRCFNAAGAAIVLVSFVACGKTSDTAGRDSSTGSSAAAPVNASAPSGSTADTGAHAGMSGMQGMSMTGDPNRDFLRMMSDHHKALSAMAHEAVEKGQNVKADAQRLDKIQDAELDTMVTMLAQQYKDDYTPKIIPDNQQMVDELKGKSGKDYSRTFLTNVIKHHEQAIKMIDDYLPKAKNAQLKSMAEKMKTDQTQEIAKFQKELSAT